MARARKLSVVSCSAFVVLALGVVPVLAADVTTPFLGEATFSSPIAMK